ncbi:MAG: hypothetical protein ACE361_19150 [Aureliella sp.]
MHHALWSLLKMDFVGGFRGLLNLRKNWRQAFLFALMLAFVGFFIYARTSNPDLTSSRFGPAMPFWSLLYLLATWLTASADRGLVMRPAEIHFLVGGPFRDYEVVSFNLVRLAFRSLVSAVVLSLLAMAYVESFASALIGMWMMITVSLLVGMIASLSAKRSQANWLKNLRRGFNFIAIGSLLVLISQSVSLIKERGKSVDAAAIASAAIETPLGSVLLAPLRWMFAPLASPRLVPDTFQLLPARLAVLGALVGAVYLLSGRYLEASTRRTDISIRKRQSALRSGVAGTPGKRPWLVRFTLPMFGRLGGIGSIAWMQMQHTLRVLPRFFIFTVAIVGVVLVLPMTVDRERISGVALIGWMTGLTLYADFLLLLQLPVGFLGPVAQREAFKSLPIPAWRVVFGLLAGPVIPLSAIHLIVFGLFCYLSPREVIVVTGTAIALLPAAAVLIANINLLGSWNIIRPRALQQRDALAAGRAMASVWVFFMMLLPAVFCGSLTAGAVGVLISTKPLALVFGSSIGVALSTGIYVMFLARSFAGWQPSSAEGGKEEIEYER